MEEVERARSKGGRGGLDSIPLSYFHALSLWNLGMSPTLHINVVTNQEASLSIDVQSFYWGFIIWASINSLPT